MTDDSLLVEDVEVIRAPGFETGGFPVTDLSPGINIVHGPNASGKTTLARSIQWLLWPAEATDRSSLTGQLSLNGESWRVEVDPGRVRYQRDGQDANGPNLPPADQRDRYHLALHDLLQQDTRNETFAKTIKRESAGGYDLKGAHESLDFSETASDRRLSIVTEAEQALKDWREAKDNVQELREEQHRLSSLRRELEEAEDAHERVTLLDQAIEYAEAKKELAAAQAKVDEFPDVLSDLSGDEADDVDAIETRIEDWREKKENAEDDISNAEDDLAEAGLPDDGVQSGTIDRLKELRDEYDSLTDKERQHEANLSDAEAQRTNAISDIPLNVDEDDLVHLDPDVWKDVSEFAHDAEKVRAEREIQNKVERWLDEDEELETDFSTVERASKALENWLASSPAEEDDGDETFLVAISSAVLLAIAGGLLGILVHPAFFVFDLIAAAIAWYGYQARNQTSSNDARATHRETFQGLGIEGPDSWSEPDVRERLNEIYDEIAAHRVVDRREQIRETLSTDIDELEAKEQALDERREELRDRLGVDIDSTDIQVLVIVKGILRWQESHDRVLGLREKIEEVNSQIESIRKELRDELEVYGYEELSDVPQATAHIRDLEARKSTHESAKEQIERAEATIAEADETISDLESEREEVFETANLSPGDNDRLRELCDQVGDYVDAVKERDGAAHLVKKEETDLEAYPNYEPELKERTAPDLRQEKRDLEDTAEENNARKKEITKIKTKIDEAKRSDEVEEALAEKERALNAVADQLDDDYDSMVGHVLTEHVRESTQETSRPDVFQRAGDILGRITKGQYRLDMDEEADTFRAYDTVKERGYALDELSSATRLQVLLSVRVAFVEQQEQGVQLPLILDETLANTDDGKAQVIIESMIELAREGRQIFYFTAQGDEVARWLAGLEDRDDVDHAVVDLATVRDTDGHVDVPDLGDIANHPPAPPDIDGHDHESYREELDIPEFDPRQGPGNAHLWYVIDDVDLLHRLLNLGIERWGQLENLLERTDGEAITDEPDDLERIQRNGEALKAFVRAWQKGRGERVDRQVLEDSGAVSENFIDDVTDLAKKNYGDAEEIMAGLRNGEVDGFWEGKKDELEQYFEENGYIEPVDPLEPEEIRARVTQAFLSNDVPRERAGERAEQLISRLAYSPS